MSSRFARRTYGAEPPCKPEPDHCDLKEDDQLPGLVQEISKLLQRDYILLATFLRALTR
ncbi:hypothetical protein PsAD2_00711 [Pseudovibrio axinellae]|uniref:Uncharacterized protein n=1 Tax=Pseudovibrio axinellae TaxID=989403 RepID=A0A161V8V4_9HYPH|nr:hypothetical protein [Pseudovibrio axinellae]KZL21419.1 hypothetical protein PsAD2_00711 [Pseudovibrio axinellae]SEQ99580.1 hypothetical protein SAMN05421798_105334 [Pseudovibrio axinellae]